MLPVFQPPKPRACDVDTQCTKCRLQNLVSISSASLLQFANALLPELRNTSKAGYVFDTKLCE